MARSPPTGDKGAPGVVKRDEAAAKPLLIRLLNGFALVSAGGEPLAVRGTKAQCIVAYAALQPLQACTRNTLMGLLWSDRGQAQAQASLRMSLSEIRAAFRQGASDAFVADRDSVSLKPELIAIDCRDMLRLAADAAPTDVLAWSGELLTNLDGVDPQFDEWLFFARAKVRGEYCAALETRMCEALSEASLPLAAGFAERILRVDPASELAHRVLITHHADMGNVGTALRQYEVLRQTLSRTLDAVPSRETEELVRNLRAGRHQRLGGPGQVSSAPAAIGTPSTKGGVKPPSAQDGERTAGGGSAAILPAIPGLSKPGVAVLPFVNMSGDPEQAYFSDGITEDLITELSRFRTIAVVSRSASFAYRGESMRDSQIGKKLGAQFLVEGSVRRINQRVRVTVQVINCETQHHVWADHYDVPLDEIFEVQDEVTRRIVATIVPRMESESADIARRRLTDDMRAYDFFLRGKASYHLAMEGRATMFEAGAFFQKAVDIDSDYAGAYGYLACIENILTMYTQAGQPLAPFRERAWQYATKSVLLDGSDPHAHLCLAWGYLWRREFAASRKHLDIAARLNPNDADFAVDRGTTLAFLGEPEAAVQVIESAIRLNPHHRDSYLSDLAEAYFVAHRYRDMIEITERIRDPYPRFSAWKCAGYALDGQVAKAKRLAADFVRDVRAIWTPELPATPANFVAWVIDFCPFRRQQDMDHLVAGLRRAGLPIPVSLPDGVKESRMAAPMTATSQQVPVQ